VQVWELLQAQLEQRQHWQQEQQLFFQSLWLQQRTLLLKQ
jgi:hypothetical protein